LALNREFNVRLLIFCVNLRPKYLAVILYTTKKNNSVLEQDPEYYLLLEQDVVAAVAEIDRDPVIAPNILGKYNHYNLLINCELAEIKQCYIKSCHQFV